MNRKKKHKSFKKFEILIRNIVQSADNNTQKILDNSEIQHKWKNNFKVVLTVNF